MGKHYSLDLRKRAIAAYESGQIQEAVAARFNICRRTFCLWLEKHKAGDLAPKPRSAGTPYKIDAVRAKHLLDETPDLTLQEMADGLGVTAQAVWYHLTGNGITHKKKDALPRAGR